MVWFWALTVSFQFQSVFCLIISLRRVRNSHFCGLHDVRGERNRRDGLMESYERVRWPQSSTQPKHHHGNMCKRDIGLIQLLHQEERETGRQTDYWNGWASVFVAARVCVCTEKKIRAEERTNNLTLFPTASTQTKQPRTHRVNERGREIEASDTEG